MKKLIFIISFITIFFIFSAPAWAACSWETEITTTTYTALGSAPVTSVSGGCIAKSMLKDSDTKCSGTKPTFSINSGKSAVCCCDGDLGSTDKMPLFNIPDLQVKIPGMQNFSQTTCIPGASGGYFCQIPWIGQYIIGIYNYAISIVGILAAIMLMAGGLLWLLSSGDASKISQAKELIIGSVTGLIILAASYIILGQINPNLVNFSPTAINTVADVEPLSSDGNINNSTECNNCVSLQSAIPYKNGHLINSDLNAKLATAWANSGSLKWRVTEAYPPSSMHNSLCHNNGMCVDIALTTDKSCTNVNKLISILKNAGVSVLNEYTGCGGTQTTYATGGHLHVR
ncbi:MAG: pilin [Patescibacteria group bacterium]